MCRQLVQRISSIRYLLTFRVSRFSFRLLGLVNFSEQNFQFQIDFDDGFCPTWRNIVLGIYNVTAAVHSILPGGPTDMTKA